MNSSDRTLTLVRLGLAGGALLALTVLLAVLGISIYRGVSLNSSQLIGLLAAVGTLVALISNLIGTNVVATRVQATHAVAVDTQQKINGHMEEHIGHTDAQINTMVDRRLEEKGITPASPEGSM